MGQYYFVANLDKNEYLNPHRMDEGLKLLEFGMGSGGTMSALAILLASGNNRGGGDLHSNNPVIGSWAGDRIVVAGDYADPGKHLTEEQLEIYRQKAVADGEDPNEPPTLYRYASEFFKDISIDAFLALCEDEYIREDKMKKFQEDLDRNGSLWSPVEETFKAFCKKFNFKPKKKRKTKA